MKPEQLATGEIYEWKAKGQARRRVKFLGVREEIVRMAGAPRKLFHLELQDPDTGEIFQGRAMDIHGTWQQYMARTLNQEKKC